MTALIVGIVLVLLALAAGAVALLLPTRRPAGASGETEGASPRPLTPRERAAGTGFAERVLEKQGRGARLADQLELAGIALTPAAFVTRAAIWAGVALVLGLVIALWRGGPAWLLPIVLVAVAVFGARVVISRRLAKRRSTFADQLDDTLQLLASSLRAGHSLPAAVNAVAAEAEAPTSEEFGRLLNKHRLGFDLGQAIEECAERMACEDLAWTAQAVTIHREVGGNLGEVLDHVGDTIRERNGIRRQVRTLSAEGRMSANVLIALPILIAVVLSVLSPTYLTLFFTTPIGWLMIGVSIVLFAIGVLWLRAVTRIRF